MSLAAPQTGKLTKLLSTRPASILSALTGQRDGRWFFTADGGALNWFNCNALVDCTTPLSAPGDLVPLKQLAIGTMGVRPAELLLHPDASLDDGATTADWIFLAGGHLGLWAMHLDPSGSTTNRVVRIDDSGNLNPLTQNSRRFCNQLAVITVDGQRLLLATFAKLNQSMLRVYDLDALTTHLNLTPAGIGWPNSSNLIGSPHSYGFGKERAADRQVQLYVRPGNVPSTLTKTFGGCWPQGMATDTIPGTGEVDVYVAMDCHGLVRVRFTPGTSGGGGGPTTPIGLLTTSTTWGPYFGDDSPYYLANQTDWTFRHWRVFDLSRSHSYGTWLREDPPHFRDVVVERVPSTNQVFVYAACDHLGWVKFDASATWNDSLPIVHHEGIERAVAEYPDWVENASSQDPAFSKTPFAHPWDQYAGVFAPVDRPPLAQSPPTAAQLRDQAYAKQLQLVDPPPGVTGIQRKLPVVTYGSFRLSCLFRDAPERPRWPRAAGKASRKPIPTLRSVSRAGTPREPGTSQGSRPGAGCPGDHRRP